MKIISETKPMMGRLMTPRGTLRAITLDKNFSKEKWLYNKNQLDDFNPAKSKKDVERSKSLRRISKRQAKQRLIMADKLEKNRTFYSSMSSRMGMSEEDDRNITGAFTNPKRSDPNTVTMHTMDMEV